MDTTDFVETDTSLEDVARWLHGEICDCDDRNCTIETQLLDWLKNGDPYGMTLQELLNEAIEYDFLGVDSKMGYEVLEDNGGGLHLFVMQGKKVIYAHSGYEYNPGQLFQDLDALDNGADVRDWDGNSDHPQAEYDSLTSYEYGWNVVATRIGSKRKLYPANMGTAARLEFFIPTERNDNEHGHRHFN